MKDNILICVIKNIHIISCVICIISITFFSIYFYYANFEECDTLYQKGIVKNIQNITKNITNTNITKNITNTIIVYYEKIYVRYNISYNHHTYPIDCVLHNYTEPIYNSSLINIFITDNLHICYEYIVHCTKHEILPIFIFIISVIISCFVVMICILGILVCIYNFFDN